jgi:putative NADH-flavin reductase
VKLAVFGSGGNIGSRVVTEAQARGHEVTALRSAQADVTDAQAVAGAAAGHDAIVSAVGSHEDFTLFARAAHALLDGAAQAGVPRLVVLGGAGSLLVDGRRVVDGPDFPELWKGNALGQADALAVLRANDTLDWTYISPAAMIEAGERTGRYRVGGEELLTDADGNSRISYEDYAVALVDELERGAHLRERIGVAY